MEEHRALLASGLTEEEAEAMGKVTEASNAVLGLPELHPSDRAEIIAAVHVIQSRVFMRPAYRKYLDATDPGLLTEP